MITETIKQSVTAVQAAESLGIRVNRHGRCQCPIHNGKDYNMRLYPDDRGFHCFVCGASGDVIHLVEAVQQCSFWSAVEWLNSAFHLGLPLDRPLDKNESESAEIARKHKQTEREQEKQIDGMLFDCWVIAGQLLTDLEEDAKKYRPTRPYQDWDKRYADAVKMIPEVRDFVEWLDAGVIRA